MGRNKDFQLHNGFESRNLNCPNFCLSNLVSEGKLFLNVPLETIAFPLERPSTTIKRLILVTDSIAEDQEEAITVASFDPKSLLLLPTFSFVAVIEGS